MSITTTQFAVLFLSTFLLSGFLTWPVRKLAIYVGALDQPDGDRKKQATPVPYFGGIAISSSILIISISALLFGAKSSLNIKIALTVLVPAAILGLLGLIDDLKTLPPKPRLVIQTFVGSSVAIYLIDSGTIGSPFNNQFFDTVITTIWIVGICNAINFFDNLDGAASGSTGAIFFGIFVIAFLVGQEMVAALSIVAAGATFGFLLWNKSPAKIYMGDAGSLFLGVLIGVLTIRLDSQITPEWKSLLLPVLLMGIPLLDTSVAVLSRISRGVSPLTGGSDHLSHRLVRAGLSRRMAAVVLWSASGVCAVMAVGVYQFADSLGTLIITGFAALWLIALVLFLRTPSQD